MNAKAQTNDLYFFAKDYSVSSTILRPITDKDNLPLKAGSVYRVKLTVPATGTHTGAEYLVWKSDASWKIRPVTLAGNNSNHPLLVVDSNTVKVMTNHANNYTVRVYTEVLPAGAAAGMPAIFGASDQWQRLGNNLFYEDGNVGIGTDAPAQKLSVNGNIRAKEIKVETANWPDYVLKKGYPLMSLESLQKEINRRGHLPGMPSAGEVEKKGLALGELNRLLTEKNEELTLYILALYKEIKALKETQHRMEQRLQHLMKD
ncbi:hypothetical protein A8C56_02740 [Niabella ginsenosidivorans]|uniref:Peptidase S74 domain-containing protein n=2 Tax=Niabella ginsenosidivorans TaxID=1176587 RepID=A0A1A9HZY2_9BACT|nr:hypothetical protein A8C56_02740 [Niabella ginsenosidivorans]